MCCVFTKHNIYQEKIRKLLIRVVRNHRYMWLVLLGIKLCQITEKLWPKIYNPLEIFLSSMCFKYYVLIMLYNILIMTQYQFNFMLNTKEYWWVMFGRIYRQLMEQLRVKMGYILDFIIIICVSYVTNCCYCHI